MIWVGPIQLVKDLKNRTEEEETPPVDWSSTSACFQPFLTARPTDFRLTWPDPQPHKPIPFKKSLHSILFL